MVSIKVDQAKIEVIKNIPTPKYQKVVGNFHGHVSDYHIFIAHFTKVASPIFTLISKDAKFKWITQCQTTFGVLKEKLA